MAMKIDFDPLHLKANMAKPYNINMAGITSFGDVKEVIDLAIQDFEKQFREIFPNSESLVYEWLALLTSHNSGSLPISILVITAADALSFPFRHHHHHSYG
ncbi:hypothetical protein VNO77_07637 [Canavalia gladiata]|uniref:Uncharacterized protein n=1 Tax=Canavalia gladiata TaxID=3824 RepID=A0AAN9QVX1_CANGL